ncbi:transporter substrate-binding domain-containing protein [Sutterella sp.]|uniref:transporter substrate-binding domain-containing protein n=1 Tax=Sutterella sp. TaxID=1981025 RepID=UPI0026E08FF2|nr:transporter substrate-binding domain-containing protein [Sutterella sp.]MDO5530698.1 transporter substrate-binding domain-containing protein [Sutterella sp.]
MFKPSKLTAVVLSTCLLAASAVSAAELTGTLKKVQETGTITLGYRESSVPFSYLDADGKPVGYAFTVCRKVADAVQAELGLKDLKIQYQAVTSANRIPLIQNGTVDIECGSTTNSLKRQKEAAFSVAYFGIQVSAAVWKSSGIKSLMDLKGKTVTMTSGTTSDALLRKFDRENKLGIRYLMTKDFAESMQLVANKRADAFVLDDVLLAGQLSNLDNASEFTILDASLGVEPYGAMFRKDDPQFKAVVDKTVIGMIKSGELAKLYSTWFENPIPPKNVNLNFKMNSYTKELFANPSDKGI